MSETKQCFKCGETKPRTEFYKHPMMGDGLLGKCKTCTKRDVRERRTIDPEKGYRKHAEYLKTPAGKAAVKKSNATQVKKFPVKRTAHIAVGNALRDGKLSKTPCEVCGEMKVEGHHDDYSKPLSVRWLCNKHHRQFHMEHPECAK